MNTNIDSPSGLDMYPKPPAAERLRKRIGIVVVIAGGVILFVFVYGIYDRQQRQLHASYVVDTAQKAVPAIGAGKEILNTIFEPPTVKPVAPSLEDRTNGAADVAPAVSPSRLTRRTAPQMRTISPGHSFDAGEDHASDLAYQREQEAILAPTGAGGYRGYGSGTPNAAYAIATPPSNSLNPQTLGGSGFGTTIPAIPVSDSIRSGVPGMSQTAEYNLQNGQDDKTSYISRARNRLSPGDLPSFRMPPASRFVVKVGWDIPAILDQGINSDEPGEIRGRVRENVFDSATGKYVLIPQGSLLVGSYNSTVSFGQDGIQAVWDQVIFPDGSSLDLHGMIGQDAQGESGLRYAVDHHYTRLAGFAVLTSLFSAGFQLSQNRPGTILSQPTPGEVVAGAVGGQVSQLGMEITRRNLNVQPTIKVPAGYRFNVRVHRDIIFDSPYSPFH